MLQQMSAFLVNFAALVVHLVCGPWVNHRLDTTQAYSILAQTVTIFYSIMLFIMQNSADQSVGSLGKLFVEMLIIAVNCFVTLYPLFMSVAKPVMKEASKRGLSLFIRRIPVGSWILLLWDLSLLCLSLLASSNLYSTSITIRAYIDLAYKSSACFVGGILGIYICWVILSLYMQGRMKDPSAGQFLRWNLCEGIFNSVTLVIFWIFLEKAWDENQASARNACLISSGTTIIFMGIQFHVLDGHERGWKRIQADEDESLETCSGENCVTNSCAEAYEEDDDDVTFCQMPGISDLQAPKTSMQAELDRCTQDPHKLSESVIKEADEILEAGDACRHSIFMYHIISHDQLSAKLQELLDVPFTNEFDEHTTHRWMPHLSK